MRLSLRKVVKYTAFLLFVFILNVWISYTVNIWTFNNFSDRGKVDQTYGRRPREVEDGGSWPSPPRDGNGDSSELSLSYKQRNAKSFISNTLFKSNTNNNPLEPMAINSHGEMRPLVAYEENRERKDSEKLYFNEKEQNILPKRFHPATLNDIFISVKTTSRYHDSRIHLLLKTWYLLAKEQTHFFTDAEDSGLKAILGDYLINTNCSTDHSRRALSCKMATEIDYYMASRKKWFCHMDDDVYLNVPRLVEKLQQYNYKEDWYLGKPSLKHPLEVTDRENPGMKLTFWFATGGAGFCISRSLALKMAPYASGGRFMTTAETIRLPDDCTLGYIIEHLLKKQLTVVGEFHSHLEPLWAIKSHQMQDQITFSFSETSGKQNSLNVEGFSVKDDPTRFRSLHCFLFPNFHECLQLKIPHV